MTQQQPENTITIEQAQMQALLNEIGEQAAQHAQRVANLSVQHQVQIQALQQAIAEKDRQLQALTDAFAAAVPKADGESPEGDERDDPMPMPA